MRAATLFLFLTLVAPSTAMAESPESPGGELRQEIRRYFGARLRAELSLTDDQLRALEPEFDEMERARRRHLRERAESARKLQAALRRGAPDDVLAELLARLDAASARQEDDTRERIARIDALLSVRQRAELRFFLPRFRQEMERRIQEFRESPPGAGRPRPARPGRRAPIR